MFNFTCPHCNRPQTVTKANHSNGFLQFKTVKTQNGYLGLEAILVVCANSECIKPTVNVAVRQLENNPAVYNTGFSEVDPLIQLRLIPESAAKPQPEYIPAPLREDYTEACRIKDLSAKASATLSRRCLQGMIRDFCGIKKSRLIDEINELMKTVERDEAPKGVSDDSVEAIDAVRKIGNIGAHMEKDINLIIDVDPDEAQVLIELVETLFDEWYIEREKRKNRFAKIRGIAEAKDEQKKIAHEKPIEIEGPKPE